MAVSNLDLIDQLKAAREGVGVHDASRWGQVWIEGPDAAAFLHRMLSNEVRNLGVGEGRYQGLLDRKGMTLSLFYLLRTGDEVFLGVTPPQLTEKTIDALSKVKFIEKLAIRDATAERGLLSLAGPGAESLLADLPKDGCLVWTDREFRPPWIDVSGPKDKIAAALAASKGKAVSLSDEAVRLIRLEAGFPEYGVDIDETHILLETAVPSAHQRNKGCYPGQEVIEKISTYGKGRAPRRFCSFALPGERALPKGTEVVTPGGTRAGTVTSALFDPLDRVTRVMASLETKMSEDVLADVGQCQFLAPPAP